MHFLVFCFFVLFFMVILWLEVSLPAFPQRQECVTRQVCRQCGTCGDGGVVVFQDLGLLDSRQHSESWGKSGGLVGQRWLWRRPVPRGCPGALLPWSEGWPLEGEGAG